MDVPRKRFADPRPTQEFDECEICGEWRRVLKAIDYRCSVVLCFECAKDNQGFRDVWDWLTGGDGE